MMKQITTTLFAILVVLSSCNSNAQDSKDTQKVQTEQEVEVSYLVLSPQEFKAKLNAEGTDVQLIDVRTAQEYDSGTIENAKNYDISNGTFEKQLSTLDKSKTVFVFCAKGGRSGRASKLLEENGFTSIVDLKGGFTAWNASE